MDAALLMAAAVALVFAYLLVRNARPRRMRRFRAREEADRRKARQASIWTGRVRGGISPRAWEEGRAIVTGSGLRVRSLPEARIAEWLELHGVPYEYEPEVCGFRPDFLLPDANVVVEYWGGRDRRYRENRRTKTRAFLQAGFALVSLEAGKPVPLEEDLRRQLWHKGVRPRRQHRTDELPAR